MVENKRRENNENDAYAIVESRNILEVVVYSDSPGDFIDFDLPKPGTYPKTA